MHLVIVTCGRWDVAPRATDQRQGVTASTHHSLDRPSTETETELDGAHLYVACIIASSIELSVFLFQYK
jgi:hypothetical protein